MIPIRGDSMKKNSALLFAVCTFVVSFISFWYADVLFNRLWIFGLIPLILSILVLAASLIVSIVFLVRKPNVIRCYLPALISIFTIVVLVVFPFRTAKVKLELQLYEKARTRVVEMVQKGEIISDHLGNAELPVELNHLSSDGYIFVYQNDEEQVVSFWVYRGMLSGSVQLIYSSEDENLIRENETGHPIISIEKLKEHWYLVETDY